MNLDRLSPRARARWAVLLGVVTAGALAGGRLVGLNRDVLPFTDWAALGAHERGGRRRRRLLLGRGSDGGTAAVRSRVADG